MGTEIISMRARRLEQKDLPYRVEWFNEKSVSSQMWIPHPFTMESTAAWFEANRANERRMDFVFDAVGSAESVPPAAMAGLVEINREHRRAELYIVVKPGLTGRGVGSRAVRWLCNHGFASQQLHKIFLYTLATNEGVQGFYERLGFVIEGVLREHVVYGGKFVDRHVHGLLRREWEQAAWRVEHPTFDVPEL